MIRTTLTRCPLHNTYPRNFNYLYVYSQKWTRFGFFIDSVRQQLCAERVPRKLNAHGGLGARHDHAAGREDEHDDGRVGGTVHETREHRALERALDIVIPVEAVEVQYFVVQM